MRARRWIILALLLAVITVGLRFCVVIVPPDKTATLRTSSQTLDLTADQDGPKLLIPVDGIGRADLIDTFRQSREVGQRVHNAIDILAPRGTAVRAAASGVVEKLFVSERGGNTIYMRSADRKWVFYYAHLDSYAPGLFEGMVVKGGALIGTVGSTGNASADAPHLHLSVNRATAGQSWYEGKPINPYPLLMAR